MSGNELHRGEKQIIQPDEYVSPTTYPLAIYKIALFILGSIVGVVLLSMIYFSYSAKEIDSAIVAIGSAALGGIVGIFAGGKNT